MARHFKPTDGTARPTPRETPAPNRASSSRVRPQGAGGAPAGPTGARYPYPGAGPQQSGARPQAAGGASAGRAAARRQAAAASQQPAMRSSYSDIRRQAAPTARAAARPQGANGAQTARPTSGQRTQAAASYQQTAARQQAAPGYQQPAARPQVANAAPARRAASGAQRPAGRSQRHAASFAYGFAVQEYESGISSLRRRRRDRMLRRLRRGLLRVVAVIVAALAVCGVCLAASIGDLKARATSAFSQVSTIQESITDRDFEAAALTSRALNETVSSMDSTLHTPLWYFASSLPFVGGDVSGTRAVVSALADLSNNALVPLTQALEESSADEIFSDGNVDVESLSALCEAVERTAPVFQFCSDELDAAPSVSIARLRSSLTAVKEKVSGANATFQQAASIAPVASDMLGAEGDRTYLLVAQNSAELRASGGFPGSVGTLSIRDGHIYLGSFTKVYAMMSEETPDDVELASEEQSLFYGYTRYSWDNSFNPDFERVGSIWASAYEEQSGQSVDGVISLTPSVVQRLLKALGASITLSDGTVLTGDNATKVLEHDLYWKYLSSSAAVDSSTGGDLTDTLFSEAASSTFDYVRDNLDTDILNTLMSVLGQSGNNRELLVWMADDEEEETMRSFGVAGSLDASKSDGLKLGVFANIWFGSKIGWWFGMDTQLGASELAADGTRTYHVTTTVSNYLTSAEIQAGGSYIIGGLDSTGYYEPFIYLYAPAGCSIQDVRASNGATFTETSYKGLQVLYTADVSGDYDAARPSFAVYPGQSVQITYKVVVPAGIEGDLSVSSTPTLQKYR